MELKIMLSIIFFLTSTVSSDDNLWVNKLRFLEYYHLYAIDVKSGDNITKSLEKAVNFLWTNRREMDFMIYAGVFAARIQIEAGLRLTDLSKAPRKLIRRINEILIDLKKIISYFTSLESVETDPLFSVLQKVVALSLNDVFWLTQIGPGARYMKTVRTEYSKTEPPDKGLQLFQEEMYKLSPEYNTYNETAYCLSLLLENPYYYTNDNLIKECTLPWSCIQFVMVYPQDRTIPGFHHSHRIYMILLAENLRRCYITNTTFIMIEKTCNHFFSSCIYIQENNYTLINMLTEEIAACSFAGIANLMKKLWIDKIIEHQSDSGCYKTSKFGYKWYKAHKKFVEFKYFAPEVLYFEGRCDRHMTAAAVASLGGALRFVLELYTVYNSRTEVTNSPFPIY